MSWSRNPPNLPVSNWLLQHSNLHLVSCTFFHCFRAHFFLALNNIPLSRSSTLFIYWRTCGFLTSTGDYEQSCHKHSNWCRLCVAMFSVSLGKYQEWMLGCITRVHPVLWETNLLSSEVALWFCTPTSRESSCCSTPQPAFVAVRCNPAVGSQCCFNLRIWMTHEGGHLFTGFSALCATSLMRFLLMSLDLFF